MVPKGCHVLILGTCECVSLYGKRDFADVIKELDMNNFFFFTNHIDAKCNHKNTFKRQSRESEPEEM